MDEAIAKRDCRELTNVALEDANRYIQRYYLNKKDMQSEDREDKDCKYCIAEEERYQVEKYTEC